MIKITQLSKSIGKTQILSQLNLQLEEGQICSLIGTNGAGKSTLLRLMSGIYRPTEGMVTIDGDPVYDNPGSLSRFFFVPDDLHFAFNETPLALGKFYGAYYPEFDHAKYQKLLTAFSLNPKKRILSMSKGMKRLVAILAAICSNTKYAYFDESFDGLDPVMRQSVKSLLADELESRGLTPIITSHNLREQEDISDYVAVLHKGEIVLAKDLLELKCNIQKVECCFQTEEEAAACLEKLTITKHTKKGPLYSLTIEGDREEVMQIFQTANTTYLDILPLSLEEIFITEMEAIGYDIKKLIVE